MDGEMSKRRTVQQRKSNHAKRVFLHYCLDKAKGKFSVETATSVPCPIPKKRIRIVTLEESMYYFYNGNVINSQLY